MRRIFGLFACAGAAIALAGCGFFGGNASYRYMLTLNLETPDGLKTGFNVVEVEVNQAPEYAGGAATGKVVGEALYLDLGPSVRPLVALLTRATIDPPNSQCHWLRSTPTCILKRLTGGPLNKATKDSESALDVVRRFSRQPTRFLIQPDDLPDLVAFDDSSDPRSARLVDPNNLEATLGPGFKWQSLTIEVTGDPVTSGIGSHLPWLADDSPDFAIKKTDPASNRDFIIRRTNFRKNNEY